jgi:hypothetical protein
MNNFDFLFGDLWMNDTTIEFTAELVNWIEYESER